MFLSLVFGLGKGLFLASKALFLYLDMKASLHILIILLILTGCKNEAASSLGEVENMMSHNPTEAYEKLRSINYESLSERNKAYYSVLASHLEATLKYPFSDTLRMAAAVAYYASSAFPDRIKYMMALHYNAEKNFQKERYQESMTECLKATAIANDLGDKLWLGRNYRLLKKLDESSLNFPKMQKDAHIAAQYFREIDSLGHYQYEVMAEALAMSNLGNPEKALKLIDSLYTVIPYYSPMTEQFANNLRAEMLRRIGKSKEALRIWETLPNYYRDEDIDDIVTFGNILVDNGMLDRCDSLVQTVVMRGDTAETEHPDFLRLRYRLCKERGDYKDALDYYVRSASELYRRVETMMGNSAMKYRTDFYREQDEARQREYATRQRWYAAVLAAIVLAALGTLLLIRRKAARRRKEFDIMAMELSDLRREAEQNTEEMTRLQESLASETDIRSERAATMRAGFDALASSLGFVITEFGNSVESESEAYRRARMQKAVVYINSDERYAVLETSIDSLTGGIFGELRAAVPALKEAEIRVYLLRAVGLSRHGVAAYTGTKYWTLCSRINRTNPSVSSSDWPRKDEFFFLVENGIKTYLESRYER